MGSEVENEVEEENDDEEDEGEEEEGEEGEDGVGNAEFEVEVNRNNVSGKRTSRYQNSHDEYADASNSSGADTIAVVAGAVSGNSDDITVAKKTSKRKNR
jgi:hypothetical protein